MYRFLFTPRWLGLAALTVVLAVVMVRLGVWQLDRYHDRTAYNERLAATARAEPVPLADVVPAPTGPVELGPAPGDRAAWTRVSVTGHYDGAHEILVRDRSNQGAVGFEVLTPLVLADGSAVLVDRGWIPPAPGGAIAVPDPPPVPAGAVTVVGRVHLTESGADPVRERAGYQSARRISPARAAAVVPYPLFDAYLLAQSQQPAADPRLREVTVSSVWAIQNGGYAVQWWIFAVVVLVGFGHLARREAGESAGRVGGGPPVQGADGVEGVGGVGRAVQPVAQHPGEP